jgi:hypothetical protein
MLETGSWTWAGTWAARATGSAAPTVRSTTASILILRHLVKLGLLLRRKNRANICAQLLAESITLSVILSIQSLKLRMRIVENRIQLLLLIRRQPQLFRERTPLGRMPWPVPARSRRHMGVPEVVAHTPDERAQDEYNQDEQPGFAFGSSALHYPIPSPSS